MNENTGQECISLALQNWAAYIYLEGAWTHLG